MTGTARETVTKVIRLTAIILLSALAGIMLGQFVSNYELRFMLSREYSGSRRGIEVYTAGDINEGNLEAHLLMLDIAPAELTECCDRIYFTGSDLELPIHDAGLGSALGLTQNRTVYISTESFSTYVVFHELFHAYDNAHGVLSSTSEEFRAAYDADSHVIPVFSTYSSAAAAEYFAQAGAMYLIIPTELSIAAPDTYRFFSETLSISPVSRGS